MLDEQIQDYALEVIGRLKEQGESGSLGVICAEDINLQYVGTVSALEKLLNNQNVFLWVGVVFDKGYSHTLEWSVTCDEEMLSTYIKDWDAFQDMKKPQDAYISEYSEEEGKYEIIPETMGTQLEVEAALDYIKGAVLACKKDINLEELDCYEAA